MFPFIVANQMIDCGSRQTEIHLRDNHGYTKVMETAAEEPAGDTTIWIRVKCRKNIIPRVIIIDDGMNNWISR